MKSYSVVYCFLDSHGCIEQNEDGEIVYSSIVDAKNKNDAIKVLKQKEKFVSEPEILNIREVQNGNN